MSDADFVKWLEAQQVHAALIDRMVQDKVAAPSFFEAGDFIENFLTDDLVAKVPSLHIKHFKSVNEAFRQEQERVHLAQCQKEFDEQQRALVALQRDEYNLKRDNARVVTGHYHPQPWRGGGKKGLFGMKNGRGCFPCCDRKENEGGCTPSYAHTMDPWDDSMAWPSMALTLADFPTDANVVALRDILVAQPELVNAQILFPGTTYKSTVLYTLARAEGEAGIRMMLALPGCDVNAVNSCGCTALHVAYFRGHVKCVAALMGAKPDVTVCNMWGETPIARTRGDVSEATVEALKHLVAPCTVASDTSDTPDSDIPALFPCSNADQLPRVPMDAIERSREVLGHGATATVYAASIQTAAGVQHCAFKHFMSATTKAAAREISNMTSLGGLPALIPVLAVVCGGTGADEDVVGLLMERMPHDLHAYLNKNVAPVSTVLTLLETVADGLAGAHRRGILHLDVKPQNVLVSEGGRAFLGDWGSGHQSNRTFGGPSTLSSVRGTPMYIAPEYSLDYTKVTDKCDVFSFGMLLWQCLHMDVTHPLGPGVLTDMQCMMNLMQGARPAVHADLHPRLAALIARCWSADAAARPPMQDVAAEISAIRGEVLSAEHAYTQSMADQIASISEAEAAAEAQTAEAARQQAAVDALVQQAHGQANAELAAANAEVALARAAARKAEEAAAEARRQLAVVDKYGLAGAKLNAAIAFSRCYRPVMSAHDAIMACRFPNVDLLTMEQVATAAAGVAHDALAADAPELRVVGADAGTAIAAYTVGFEGAVNFHAALNLALKTRAETGAPLGDLEAYMYYVCHGLSMLPPPPKGGIVVYRGLPATSYADTARRYTVGTTVFWSTFTSTSLDLAVALRPSFSDDGGVLFKITTLTGRNIAALSAARNEREILLAPNTQFVVTKPMYAENRRHVVEMVEVPDAAALVR